MLRDGLFTAIGVSGSKKFFFKKLPENGDKPRPLSTVGEAIVFIAGD